MAIKTNLTTLAPRRLTYKKTITLPSHGYSSPHAWPDGSITVYPWDNDMDDYLLELNRKATNRQTILFDMVAKLCDLNGGNIDDFVADETNIVLLVARALSQDSTMSYRAECPFCTQGVSQEEIKVPDELEKVSEKSSNYVGYDEITLPKCKDTVRIRPLLIKDERIVLSRTAEERAKLPDNMLRDILRIVSVCGGIPDSVSEIRTWLEALHPTDIRYLGDQARLLSPHLNTLLPHKCANETCRREFKYPLTFDQDFFR